MTSLRRAEAGRLSGPAGVGDGAAATSLLARYREPLERIVAARLEERLAALTTPARVADDVLAAAADELPGFLERRGVPLLAWLRGLAIGHLARLAGSPDPPNGDSPGETSAPLSDAAAARLTDALFAQGDHPLGAALQSHLRARLCGILARLTEAEREILVLCELESLDVRQAAAVLDVDAETLERRYDAAVVRLRRLVAREEESNGDQAAP